MQFFRATAPAERVLAVAIPYVCPSDCLSVCPSVCHDPAPNQAQLR